LKKTTNNKNLLRIVPSISTLALRLQNYNYFRDINNY